MVKPMRNWGERIIRFIPPFVVVCLLAGCATPKPAEMIWPLPPDEPRIKYVKSIRSAADVEKRSLWKTLVEAIVGAKSSAPLAKPYAVHVDREGRLFVTDSAWPAVLIFDMKNQKFSVIGLEGPGVLAKPMGVTTDAAGRIYVTDTLENRGVVYDHDGNFLIGIGEKGRFDQPVGIAVNDALNRVYIVDTRKHKVSVFNSKDGKFLFEFGARGVEDGQFNWPTNIAIDKDGKLFVMDTFNFRVQVFDPDGKFLSKFGSIGSGLGQFSKPKGIALDTEGHVYVVDAAFNNVQIFDQQGQLLLFFGGFGNRPGQLWLPAGMYIDQDDQIYVADQYNHRIDIYQYLSDKYKARQAAEANK
jgi:DNA-binding beta-propeller fold protein YncE